MARSSWVCVTDPKTGKVELVEKSAYMRPQAARGAYVIGDIDPYMPVAADADTGKRYMIGGRRQHREFLKRNGYIEIGNEKHVQPKEPPQRVNMDVVNALKRAMGKL